jgi:tight adherence protein B
LSAWVLILLPFLMALLLYIFSPEQLTILIDDPLGRLALIISMILELIGYVVIQKIVHIDV